MKFSEIPAYLGITATQLAEMSNITKQNLYKYTVGARGKPSAVVINVCDVAGLNREEVFFPDVFDHPDGDNSDKSAYWFNLAIEALKQAKLRGGNIDGLVPELKEFGAKSLADFYEEEM